MTTPYPPDEEVLASTAAAISELARHIDHQSRDVESIDTKAAALVALAATAVPVVLTRVGHLADDFQRLSSATAGIAAVALVICLFQTLRARDRFSYGPDPDRLMELVDREHHKTVLLWMGDSFAAGRALNVAFLETKLGWYHRSLRSLIATGLAVAWMVHTGAAS